VTHRITMNAGNFSVRMHAAQCIRRYPDCLRRLVHAKFRPIVAGVHGSVGPPKIENENSSQFQNINSTHGRVRYTIFTKFS